MKGGKRLVKDDYFRWHQALMKRGWLAVNWPEEYGGPGWTPVQKHIFNEECYAAGAPRIVPFGVNMVAPVIMKFGSQEQKDHYLPRILDLTDWWCQGYSEPGSGSDLASLRCSAVRDGDHYIVNGQKTWTTLGQYADHIFCLVRTNPDAAMPQEGISFLLIDMNTPGITVRPIILLEGEHEVNEVWFDNVKVPAGNIVGEENKGWTYAKYLLTHERTGIANVGASKAAMLTLKAIARDQRRMDAVAQRPAVPEPSRQVEIDLLALEANLRVLAEVQSGGAPGLSSILKIRGTEIRQELTDLARPLGPYALPFQSEALDGSFWRTGRSRLRGTDHQTVFNMRSSASLVVPTKSKNIIAKAGLGLWIRNMDFSLGEESRMLKETVERLVRETYNSKNGRKS